jgi:SiaC family regulatory phosphoprotein
MKIQQTYSSPHFTIDINSGIIEIKGKSIMVNVKEFYYPIINSIKELAEKEINTIMNIELEYFNTSSSKQIFDIFEILTKLSRKVDVYINWYYEEDDDSIYDSGLDYSLMFKKLKFNLIPIY